MDFIFIFLEVVVGFVIGYREFKFGIVLEIFWGVLGVCAGFSLVRLVFVLRFLGRSGFFKVFKELGLFLLIM